MCSGEEMRNGKVMKCRKAYLSLPGVLCRMNKTCKSSAFFWNIPRTVGKKNHRKTTRCQCVFCARQSCFYALLFCPVAVQDCDQTKQQMRAMAVGNWNWETGENGDVLVTEEAWLGDELCSVQLGARGRQRLGFRVGPASSQRGLLLPHVPLEEWDCFAKEEPARLGNTIQPQFRDRDVAKGLSRPF